MFNKIIKPIYVLLQETILKGKGCQFENNVSFDHLCSFEGENFISSGTYMRNVYMGKYSYTGYRCCIVGTKIGKYTSIGPGVKTVIGRHPTSNFVSTHPLFFSTTPPSGIPFVSKEKFEEVKYALSENNGRKYAVSIGNDVWIGANVSIFDGVTIGDGAIVGAGSIVMDDVEPYSIVVGTPAKIIRKRFMDEQISLLLKSEWWNKDVEWIKNNVDVFEDIMRFEKMERD